MITALYYVDARSSIEFCSLHKTRKEHDLPSRYAPRTIISSVTTKSPCKGESSPNAVATAYIAYWYAVKCRGMYSRIHAAIYFVCRVVSCRVQKLSRARVPQLWKWFGCPWTVERHHDYNGRSEYNTIKATRHDNKRHIIAARTLLNETVRGPVR